MVSLQEIGKKTATTSPWFAGLSLPGGVRGSFCVGPRIVATVTIWVHRGSAQLANTIIPLCLRSPRVMASIASTAAGSAFVAYCRREELVACVRKLREKLCASTFHPSKTRKTRTPSGRRSRPPFGPFFRVLEGWNSLAHNFLEVFASSSRILSDDHL